MESTAAPRQQFTNIFNELHSDRYLAKEEKVSAPGQPPRVIRNYITPATYQQRALLVQHTLNKARTFARQGVITQPQERAIQELARIKKEEIAQQVFLERPRHEFESEGDTYRLVYLRIGKYACINTSEYQLRRDALTWESKRDPKVWFRGTPTRGDIRVSPDRLCLVNEALKRRPIAHDMLTAWRIDNHPCWAPAYTERLAKGRLIASAPGTYMIHPSLDNKAVCLTYKVGQEVFHERFDRETGFLQGDESDFPETIFQRMEQLDQVRKESPRPAPAVEPHSQSNPGTVPQRKQVTWFDAPQHSRAPQSSVAKEERRPLAGLMTESQARDEIQLLMPGYAVPYHTSDGTVRILVKVKSQHVNDPFVLDLRYFPDTHEVAVKSRPGRINAAEYLRSIGATDTVRLI
jgi:hypothetical protein